MEIVFEEDILIVSIFLAAEIMLFGLFVAGPLRKVRQWFKLKLTIEAWFSLLFYDYTFARRLGVGWQYVFEQFTCFEVA